MTEQKSTTDEVFEIGTWVGRKQAFSLIAGRCSAADAETLLEIRDKKLFRKIDQTWEEFCAKRLGMTRSYVDRLIRQFQQLGPNLYKLNCFARIKPAEYGLVAGALSDEGLSYNGAVIALVPENAPKLAEAVEALRHDSVTEEGPDEFAEHALDKVDRAMRSAIAELHRLQTMTLDEARRLKLMIVVESCRDQLDLIRLSTYA